MIFGSDCYRSQYARDLLLYITEVSIKPMNS